MSKVIRFEGVTFVVEACAAMSKEQFIKAHIDAFWPSHDEATRRKMLTEVYGLISPPKSKSKK